MAGGHKPRIHRVVEGTKESQICIIIYIPEKGLR